MTNCRQTTTQKITFCELAKGDLKECTSHTDITQKKVATKATHLQEHLSGLCTRWLDQASLAATAMSPDLERSEADDVRNYRP